MQRAVHTANLDSFPIQWRRLNEVAFFNRPGVYWSALVYPGMGHELSQRYCGYKGYEYTRIVKVSGCWCVGNEGPFVAFCKNENKRMRCTNTVTSVTVTITTHTETERGQ